MKFFNTLFVLFGLITYSHADTVFLGKIQQKSAVNQNTDKKYNTPRKLDQKIVVSKIE